MTMDDTEEKVIGVDEVFESFVKKKLKQLGIKRGRAKSPDAMTKLEMRMKLRLEKNLANHNPSDESVRTKQNNSEISENSADRNSKVLENESSMESKKTEKSVTTENHNPKKQKIEENTQKLVENCININPILQNNATASVIDNLQSPDTVASSKVSKAKVTDCETSRKSKKSEKKSKHAKHSNSKTKKESKSSEREASQSKSESNTLENETSQSKLDSVTSAPKKDISIIKRKIELLKARSAEAKLKQEIDGALETTTTKPNITDHEASKPSVDAAIKKSGLKEAPTVQTTSNKGPSDLKEPEVRKENKAKKRSRERHSNSKCSRSQHPSRSRSSSPSSKRRHRHRRSRSRSKHRHRRSRSRERRHKKSRRKSRSPRRISTKDKIKLLEIAKANALAQHRANHTASSVTSIGQLVREGSMSVSELTNLCQDIVEDKPSKDVGNVEPLTKEKAEKMLLSRDTTTVHHPFSVKDTPINIKPVRSIPPPPPVVQKPIESLSKEFPVSCGQQHHKKEVMEAVYGKWEAVAKDETAKKVIKEIVDSDSVFIQPEKPNLDLSAAISERISAVRELQKNPNDKTAKNKIETAQKALDNWTQSKQIIGQFTGDSKLTAMSRNMLQCGNPAWFKPDNLKNAKPVVGIGKSLLQKMGWKPGMSLGKSMPGQLEPLSVDFKTDRRGLSSYMESPAPIQNKKSKKVTGEISRDLSNKHPVSALTEVCSKRHWAQPEFRLVDPLSMAIFTYRVMVCNDEYLGTPAATKKEAKKRAAAVALQNMGLVPKP